MAKKTKFNNTTITLSIPHDVKSFLDDLSKDGYNRSNLMLKMIRTLSVLYYNYPQIPLPRGVDRLYEMVPDGMLFHEFANGHPIPRTNTEDDED